jgi:hypothetical protein
MCPSFSVTDFAGSAATQVMAPNTQLNKNTASFFMTTSLLVDENTNSVTDIGHFAVDDTRIATY